MVQTSMASDRNRIQPRSDVTMRGRIRFALPPWLCSLEQTLSTLVRSGSIRYRATRTAFRLGLFLTRLQATDQFLFVPLGV